MEESLATLIKAYIEKTRTEGRRDQLKISHGGLTVWCGYGYYERDKCLVWRDADERLVGDNVTPETAASMLFRDPPRSSGPDENTSAVGGG